MSFFNKLSLGLKYIAFLAATILLLMAQSDTAFAQSKKKDKGKNKDKTTTSTKAETNNPNHEKIEKLLFDGILAKTKDNFTGAIDAYKECLKIDPTNDVAMYELARLYYEGNNSDQALAFAKDAANLAPDNKWYQYLYAEILALGGKFNDAAEVYKRLITKNPDGYDYYFDLAYMYLQAGNFDAALTTYDALENKMGFMPEIALEKAKLYRHLKRFEKAITELDKLIAFNPADATNYKLLADIYETQGNAKKVEETYTLMAKNAPTDPQSRLVMAQFYLRKGDFDKYIAELEPAFADPAVSLDAKAGILVAHIQASNTPDIQQKKISALAERLLKAHSQSALAFAINGELAYVYGDTKKALNYYQKALDLDSNQPAAWIHVLEIQFEIEDYPGLVETSQKMIEVFPNQVQPYFYNGLAQMRLKNYEKSIKSLKQGALMSAADKDMSIRLYSLMGEAYHYLQNSEKSNENFEKALSIDPNQANTLNNFSYFLSLRSETLDKAAQMAAKANELVPNQPSYQDTYAWVLYKQGKFTDAKKWLDKALANETAKTNATILEHYGDVLFKLNEVNNALTYWQKAKEKGSNNSKIDQKIADKKLYE